jgi:hypothetical protein
MEVNEMAINSMKDFLTRLDEVAENEGQLLFEAGKEGDKIDQAVKDMLKKRNVNYKWAYQPEGYELVVLEHKEDGEAKDSWSIIFYDEAEARDSEEEEKLFGEDMLNEQGTELVPVDSVKGNFFDIVKLCIELASNKEYKGDMSTAKAQKAVKAAKAKK